MCRCPDSLTATSSMQQVQQHDGAKMAHAVRHRVYLQKFVACSPVGWHLQAGTCLLQALGLQQDISFNDLNELLHWAGRP